VLAVSDELGGGRVHIGEEQLAEAGEALGRVALAAVS
jgi:hypothetical protein